MPPPSPPAVASASASAAPPLDGGRSAAEVEAAVGRLWNRNRPAHYGWLRSLLEEIAGGRAPAVRDLATGASGTPLLVVAGACPSVLAGMQAVVYAAMPSCVDFWWVKPSLLSPAELEPQTLHRHAKGAHKNSPGGSKAVYAPIAELFMRGGEQNGLTFSVERPESGGGAARAKIECAASGCAYYVHLIWQEDFTTNVFSRSKFIKGQIVYQRSAGDGAYFARPYKIEDGAVHVPPGPEHERAAPSVLPGDALKLGCIA